MQTKGLTETIIAASLLSVMSAGVFGAFGAMVHYLYLVVKEQVDYATVQLVAFVIMGFFVGVVVDQLTISMFGESYPGIVLISGYGS